MKRIAFPILVISIVVVLLSVECFAQLAIRRRGGGGWGAETQYGLKFNPKTIETLNGQVISVSDFTPLRQMAYGYLVMLQTDKGIIPVHVGPAWYVKSTGFNIMPKDRIIVKGSRISFNEAPAIMAMEVKKGDATLRLRSATGIPVWSESYQEKG